MDRQQVSWLIVRAFGLYFAIQAVLLVPELASSIYATRAFNSLMSSMSSDNNNLASTARQASTMYRNLWLAPLVRFTLFAIVGVYLLRGGEFLARLLQRVPDAPQRDRKASLTEREATEMTVKERLSAAGLFPQFADAVERRDVPELERILREIYLTPDDIQAVIAQMLGTSAWRRPTTLTLGGYRIAVTNIARKGAKWCITWNICFWSASSPSEPTCCPG